MMTQAKRRVTKFNFDKLMQSGSKAHVALVDKAANEQEVLVMKAKTPTVQISMEMDKFLQKFFGMWEEDADALIKILGYEEPSDDDLNPDGDRDKSYQEYDESKGHTIWVSGVGYTNTDGYIKNRIGEVSLLKGKEGTKELSENMVELIKNLQKDVGTLDAPSQEEEVIETKKSSTEGEPNMNEEEIKAMQDEIVELKKAKNEADKLKAELVELKKAKAEQREAEMVELVKGLTFVSDEEADDVVKALLASDHEGVLVVTLEKARTAIVEAATDERGHDEEEEVVTDTTKSISAVQAALKARAK